MSAVLSALCKPFPAPVLAMVLTALSMTLLTAQAGVVAAASVASAVGATAASFEVDQQGGATYRIPIAVAPGSGRLQPSPVLVYNSHTGNGPLGVGWTIEGVSAIHRCAAIAPLHGRRGRVDLGEDDRLCIDGRFLVPVDGAATPLQGRELRTRVESFTRVTANGVAAAKGFTAWTKEGRVVTYGDSANAQVRETPHGGRVFSWLMSRVADRAGNAIDVRYAEFGGERHVERIDYRGGSVLFEYEPRDDVSTAYLAGMAFPLTQRLTRVVSRAGDRLLREYRFDYENSDGIRPDRLVSVMECVEGGRCLRPTVFEWQPSPAFGLPEWGTVAHPADRSGEHRRYQPGDFNGDGLTDIYEIRGDGGGAYDAVQINLGDGSFESVTGPWTEVGRPDDLLNFHFADFDGDGLTDVYQFRYRNAYDRLYLARVSQGSLSFEEVAGIDSGTANTPAVAGDCVHRDCLRFGDFNGDGRADVYRVRHGGATALTDEVHLSNGDGTYERASGIASAADRDEGRAATQVARIRTGDFNGDGLTDIYLIWDGGTADDDAGTADRIYLTLRPGEYRRIDGIGTQINLRAGGREQLLRVKFGDFNGDGLTDVYYATPSQLLTRVYPIEPCPATVVRGRFLSALTNWLFTLARAQGPLGLVRNKKCYRVTPDQVHLSHGDGRYTTVEAPGFPEVATGEGLSVSLSRVRLADFNGDGRTDIYYMAGGRPDGVYLATVGGWRLHEGISIRLRGTYGEQLQVIERVQLRDFNGDGVADIYWIEDAYKGSARIYAARGQINLVGSIIDGLGAGLRIRYAPLTDPAFHQLAADTAPAVSRTPPPLRVVVGVETFDGSGRLRAERHLYGGARSDASGFGFLGFAWREVHDEDRQLVTRTVYSQVFPYFGSVLERTVQLAHGSVLSSSHIEYAASGLNDGRTVFPHQVRSRSQSHELDGSFVSAVTTSFSDYDEYGNVGMVETVTEDEHRRFGRAARYDYLNDRERWILGRHTREQITDSDDFHANITRTAVFEYDPKTGFLLAETVEPDDELSVIRRYEYDDFGNRIVEDAQPVTAAAQPMIMRRTYDGLGRFAVRTVNAEGHTSTRVHDERFGRAALAVDANGLAVWREYDGWGRLLGEVRPDGTRTTIVRTYELPEGASQHSVYTEITAVTGRPPRRTFHDAFGRILGVQTTGFGGRTLFEEREYDRYGRVVRISLPHDGDQPADWVERRYDRLDRLVEESSPLVDGEVTTRWFDYRGLVAEHTDELMRSKVVTRDALGRIVSVVEPMGAEMSFEYDPSGRMIRATDAHGNEISTEYDALGNRVRVVHLGQGEQRFAYSPFGRVIRATDAFGSERRMKYDRLGRLVERIGPEGTARWSYDASEYGVGRLSKEFYDGHIRRFRYDSGGRLAAIDDHRGYVIEMAYDQGRLREMRYPRGFAVEHIYNEHGHLSAVRSPFFETGDFSDSPVSGEVRDQAFYHGRAGEYERSALFYRHLAVRVGAAGDGRRLAGDLNDTADELERGAARLRRETPHDRVPRRSSVYCESMVSARLARAGNLLKDAAEAVVRLQLQASVYVERQMYARMALSGQALDEVQGCLSAMQSVADARATSRGGTAADHVYYWRALARDTVGRVVSERTGDGWQTTRRYHTGNGYLQEIRSDADGRRGIRHLVYDYDEADNLLSRTDNAQQISEYFDYDDLDRLVAAVVLSEREHDDYNKVSFYRYDALGNLVFHPDAGAYAYGTGGDPPHAAMEVGGDAYEYDASGNLVRGPGFTGEWFSFGKPASLEAGDGRRVEFAYDANGERVSKRSSGDVTHYLGKFYERTLKDGGAVEHRHYIYAGDRLVAVRYDRETGGHISRRLRYLHHDAMGSVDTITDDAGGIVERLSYTPFGRRRASNWREAGAPVPPMLVNRGFTGHEHLDEVGLVHMNGRIYDPRVGRFLSPDPYVPSPLSTQSYNRYSYALNNPMKFTDPSGFFLKKVFKGIKRAVRKVARFVRRNARVIAAVAAGYYAGVWVSNAIVKSAVSKLVWSPGGMWSGTYINAYNSALASGAVVGGAVSGGVSSALSGGDLRSVLANAVGAGALRGLGVSAGGQWTPQRVLASSVVNGAVGAVAGGSFRDAALSSLQWGGLRYAAAAMRGAMVAQSLLNPDNAGGLSAGVAGDNFKLGGGRYNVHGSNPSFLGGHQGGEGWIFGRSYEAGSLWDRVVEAYAGPHDYLNSFYWYDEFGNIKSHLSSFQRRVGEMLNAANVLVATPFAAATLAPDYAYPQRAD